MCVCVITIGNQFYVYIIMHNLTQVRLQLGVRWLVGYRYMMLHTYIRAIADHYVPKCRIIIYTYYVYLLGTAVWCICRPRSEFRYPHDILATNVCIFLRVQRERAAKMFSVKTTVFWRPCKNSVRLFANDSNIVIGIITSDAFRTDKQIGIDISVRRP